MDMTERYVRAERLLPWNANRLTSDLMIEPHWFGQQGQFWYRFRSATGKEFVRHLLGEQSSDNYWIEPATE